MPVRPARPSDRDALTELRYALWPDEASTEIHARELDVFFAGELPGPPYTVLVAEEEGVLLGFAEVSLRTVAESCDRSRPVGYLEGWYVADGHRRSGIGRALVQAGEDWARAQGCTEFASDALLQNEPAHAAHRALGFEETGRVVTFRKTL